MNQTNGHAGNGNKSINGKGNSKVKTAVKNSPPAQTKRVSKYAPDAFDQPVVLRQSPVWTRAIAVTIVAVTTFGIFWAAVAKIEQVVASQGQLKPTGKVKDIQAPPINGKVKEVFIEDGETVKKDQLLLTFDPRSATEELEGAKKTRSALVQENQFYRALLNNRSPSALESDLRSLDIPGQLASLARSRMALLAENQLFLAELNQNTSNLNVEQLLRWRASQSELESRSAAAKLEVEQLQKQLSRNRVELDDARAQLKTEQQILSQVEPLALQGAIAKLQYVRQQQEVQTRKAEVEKFEKEEQRLVLDIQQAQQQLSNTVSLTRKEVLDKIGQNQIRIAEIDSQFSKTIVDNQNRITDLESRINQTRVTLDYQELKAPVSGIVFDLKAFPGFVPAPSQAETLLKIVPDEHLIAEVYVTNENIGFVRTGMDVDVRIDTFPFSEYGDIPGKVIYIGRDALPPDQTYQFFRFPVKISLERQYLNASDSRTKLQPGMSVNANIIVRENRTVLSLFTELFTKKVESLKQIR